MTLISLISVVVDDDDEAIVWYGALPGFRLHEDRIQPDGKRWVVVGPQHGTRLLLARAADDRQRLRVGDQTGGRVFLFLETDHFDADHRSMLAAGILFEELPRREPYGKVAVFRDLYGNRWDLIERSVT
ncbi:extradiol dioxygenase [Aureimonas sp. Leaf454]|uniref:VOC family protein n=1 Tax=Aureimonas sp. Leaf454 TaxID=1736381 RepID=UPI0006F96888|nr:VOC family protein [Aureimonas sp. Leaf454]KQT43109.1 extradiol dioxygenase [Aureimonas sp. Leaf454]